MSITNSASLGCDWTVELFDHAGFTLGTHSVPGGSSINGCFTTSGGSTIDHLKVYDGSCFVQFGNLGVFSYSLVSSPCSGSTCSNSIDCSGFYGSTVCSPLGHLALLIQIQ